MTKEFQDLGSPTFPFSLWEMSLDPRWNSLSKTARTRTPRTQRLTRDREHLGLKGHTKGVRCSVSRS